MSQLLSFYGKLLWYWFEYLGIWVALVNIMTTLFCYYGSYYSGISCIKNTICVYFQTLIIPWIGRYIMFHRRLYGGKSYDYEYL